MAWQVFGTLTAGNQNLSLFDTLTGQIAKCVIIPCTATGTNAITLTGTTNAPTITTYSDLVVLSCLPANTSTGAVTARFGALSFLKVFMSDGTTQATTNDVTANFPIQLMYVSSLDSGNGGFYLLKSASSPAATTTILPGGYLTLDTTGTAPVLTSDQTAKTSVYYAPFRGNIVPIYNGSLFVGYTFTNTQIAMTTSAQGSNGIYDVYAALNSGNLVFGFGVIWSAGTSGSVTAGSCARGTGASGSALSLQGGIWTNTVQTTINNGATTYTVPAGQGTYLGSVLIDTSPGQVSCHVSFGQSRKWGVWNYYNRVPLCLQVGPTGGAWAPAGTLGPVNADGNNKGTTLVGMREEVICARFMEKFTATVNNNSNTFTNGIGFNSTTAASGFTGHCVLSYPTATALDQTLTAEYEANTALGVNNWTMLESATGSGTPSAGGSAAVNQMLINWRG